MVNATIHADKTSSSDWEYPGESGAGNTYSPQDTTNFLLFLRLLRSSLPPAARISAAVQDWPFAGQNGEALTDASEFAEVVDWVLLMNYDVWAGLSTPGSNSPLSNACGNSS